MHSMTAFSTKQSFIGPYELVWEVKSVNHRFLDIFFRLPENFRFLEPQLRQIITQKINRGRVEVSLAIHAASSQQLPHFNRQLLSELVEMSTRIADEYQIPNDFGVQACLNWPNLWKTDNDHSQEQLKHLCLETFDTVVDDLVGIRYQEGIAIAHLLKLRVNAIQEHLSAIEKQLQDEPERLQEKLRAKMALLIANVDQQRLEQELAIYLMRLDMTEEVDRLATHLHEILHVIDGQQRAIGRRLDFLIQELHRETNTISSKTDIKSIASHSIEIKVLIEQMREQIQNVE